MMCQNIDLPNTSICPNNYILPKLLDLSNCLSCPTSPDLFQHILDVSKSTGSFRLLVFPKMIARKNGYSRIINILHKNKPFQQKMSVNKKIFHKQNIRHNKSSSRNNASPQKALLTDNIFSKQLHLNEKCIFPND